MIRTLRTSLSFLALMSVLLGLLYPLGVWLAGTVLFPDQARGSLVLHKGRIVGSALLGQNFTSDHYFWPRPSATTGTPYAPLGSGASNLNPANPQLLSAVAQRIDHLKQAHPDAKAIPVDLVTASGSGLDPDISLASAQLQSERVAKARNLKIEAVQNLVEAHTQQPTFGFLGQPRVNVLRLNLALDRMDVGGTK